MNTNTVTEYRDLPLAVLSESPTNPRRIFEDAALKELAESIRSQVVLSPLLVRPLTNQSFEIVVGLSRNFRAQRQTLSRKAVLQEEIRDQMGFEQIVGKSAALRHVLELAEVFAETDATVLLLGESGTGKELIARAVHERSQRRSRTFVKLNCAAIPTGLFKSELFGHEKGAFTGAIAQRQGRMELAEQGTLFLDEVGDIPF